MNDGLSVVVYSNVIGILMNNKLSVAKMIAHSFWLCGELTRRPHDNYYYIDMVRIHDNTIITTTDIILYGKHLYSIYYTRGYFNGFHEEFTNKLASIVRHYAQCYNINCNIVVYVACSREYVDIWRFTGTEYIKIMDFPFVLSKKFTKNVSTNTLYIMKVKS